MQTKHTNVVNVVLLINLFIYLTTRVHYFCQFLTVVNNNLLHVLLN